MADVTTVNIKNVETDHQNDAVHLGVGRLFDVYAQLSRNDHVVIAYTPDSRKYAAHCVAYLNEISIPYSLVAMRPLVDDGFQERLTHSLPHPTSFRGNLVCITLEKDTMSHFEVFSALFAAYGQARTRIVRVISASDTFFSEGLALHPQELGRRNAYLLSELQRIKNFTFTTQGGTNLRISLDKKFEWISNRGVLRPGAFTILPPGEIATYPASVTGVLVADGAINCNVVSTLDMRLGSRPLRVDIKESRAVGFTCEDPIISDFVEKCFKKDHATNIGELGFGTNIAISNFIAHNSHLNERRPGLHLGFGQHNQDPLLVKYDTDIHLDLMTDGGTITGDDGTSIELASFQPPTKIEHPFLVRDEDITGDCCSSGCRVIAL